MALTSGISQQAMQGLIAAGKGQQAMDQVDLAKQAREDYLAEADVNRKDAAAKLKMSLDHQGFMQQQQITANENLQSSQFAENVKADARKAEESQKGREFVGEQNRISQELSLLYNKMTNRTAREKMEFEMKIWQGGNGYGRGGGGGGAGGLNWPGSGGGPATSGRLGFGGTSPGIYLTPKEWREQKLWADDSRLTFGKLAENKDIALVNMIGQHGNVPGGLAQAYSNHLGYITQAWMHARKEDEGAVAMLAPGFASAFGPDLMKFITEVNPNEMGGLTSWMNSWNRTVGGSFGEIVPVTPGDSIDNHYFADIRGNEEDLVGAIGEARDNAYSSARQITMGRINDKQFEEGYTKWKETSDFHSLEETNAGKNSDTSGFNQMIALEVLDTMGGLSDDEQNELRGYRSAFGDAQGNPLLGPDVSSLGGYGQGEVPAFKASSKENMQINMIKGITTNLRDLQGMGAQADVIDQITPLLITHITSGQRAGAAGDKARKEITDKIVGILSNSKGLGHSELIVMADKFLEMSNSVTKASFGKDTREALIESGARPGQINEMVNAVETAYHAVGEVGGLIHNLMSAARGGNKDTKVRQGMVQAAISNPDLFGGLSPWTGEIEIVRDKDGKTHEIRSLDSDWQANARAAVAASDIFENQSPEIRDLSLRLLFEEASTMGLQIDPLTGQRTSKTVDEEWIEAQESRAAYETAEEEYETYFDESIMPTYRDWEERGQTGYEEELGRFLQGRETLDQELYDQSMDVINRGRGGRGGGGFGKPARGPEEIPDDRIGDQILMRD